MIALLRFHLASGARVALAASVPLVGLAVFGIGVQEFPAAVIEQIAAALAGPTPSSSAIAAFSAVAL